MELSIGTVCNIFVIEFDKPKTITILTSGGEEEVEVRAINIALQVGDKWEVKKLSIDEAGMNAIIESWDK